MPPTPPIRLDSDSTAPSRWARWSYLPGPARLRVRADAESGQAEAISARGVEQRWDGPLEALAWMAQFLHQPPSAGPPFKGGWIGWLGYDLGRWFEKLPCRAVRDTQLPLLEFTWHDRVTAIDRRTGERHDMTGAPPLVGGQLEPPPELPRGEPAPVRSSFTRPAYEAAIAKAIDYIAAGDIFQVNLSQRFTAPLVDSPGTIYQRLRERFGAWFGAMLCCPDYALLCNSPELFLRVEPMEDGRRRAITRPIKGTRPRGAGMEQALRDSIKDQAELNMIVDLERNDLGRICAIGSVRVTEPRTIEAHPTVHHGAATVEGMLREEVGLVDVLRATFPGGSITGAPKIRAMQIIDELEPVRRGPYCGAIGLLSIDGHIDLNIAIRTMILERGNVHLPVGGGIVADSVPAEEYRETLDKARAMFEALGIAPQEGCTAGDDPADR